MRRSHTPFMLILSGLFLNAGCNVNVPVDPNDLLSPIGSAIDAAQDSLAGAVADPLGSKPFPVILGGDETRVFYATNLGDVRLNFPGPTSDIVLPGLLGPSNLYRFDQAPRNRELLRPLLPSGTYTGLATDGRYVVMVRVKDLERAEMSIEVLDLTTHQTRTLFDPAEEPSYTATASRVTVYDGRVAFLLIDVDGGPELIHIIDLDGLDPMVEIESPRLGSFVLRADRLVYVATDDAGVTQLRVRDLTAREETILDPAIRVDYPDQVRLVASHNRVVWAQPVGLDRWRISAYDLITGETSIIAESVSGMLAGATDTHVITEEYFTERPGAATRIRVMRYDADGGVRKLADFRADGLAGQTTVIGNRAAWVNPEREIVLAPVAGGDRTSFRPY